MRDIRESIRELGQRDDDRGVALVFVAIMLVLLIGMTAFAVDLGWLYLNGSRVQRGADASALAGVVHLPGHTAQVNAQTVNGANANGWDIGSVNGTPIPGGGPDLLTWRSLSDNRLEVDVTATVPTFFLKVFGIDELTMTRRATAEYVKPVPIGSPFPCFGNAVGTPGCPDGNFWAAIQMPYTAKQHGDPYQSLCISANPTGPPGSCIGAMNPQYRPDGYFYAVELPGGTSDLTVEVYDGTFWRRAIGQNSCVGWPETGDCDRLVDTNWISTADSGDQTTHFQLRAPDATPLDPSDNPPIPGCQIDVTRNNASYLNQWQPVCTVPSPVAGIYVLRVWTTGNSGGSNHYALRASATGGTPRLYGINDISIFTNQGGTLMNMYLAEVDPAHAGKTLRLDLYDVGEDDAEAWMTFRMPDGAIPDCNWVARNEAGNQTASGSGPCQIQTSAAAGPLHRRFNAQWLRIEIRVPSPYVCGADCWWRVEIENNQPHDRTTWAARIIGNPVRLLPNEP